MADLGARAGSSGDLVGAGIASAFGRWIESRLFRHASDRDGDFPVFLYILRLNPIAN
jgi:hypothetical protein